MTVLKASDYPKYKPIPRLHRDVVLTEKVDGSNGLIHVIDLTTEGIDEASSVAYVDGDHVQRVIEGASIYGTDQMGKKYLIRAGSRNRWLSTEKDNFGFCAWVMANADALTALGPGYHYGEWFGLGIQTGYGLDKKRFALFNVAKWYDPRDPRTHTSTFEDNFPKAKPCPSVVTVVPVISVVDGKHLNAEVDKALHTLESEGSFIAPGFMKPEGVVVFHAAAGVLFKATIHNDEKPKSQVKKSK